MRFKKTDKRFTLYDAGFDCYAEFINIDRADHIRLIKYTAACQKVLGPQYWKYPSYGYQGGKWVLRSKELKNKNRSRIYFRGEKLYTLITMALT